MNFVNCEDTAKIKVKSKKFKVKKTEDRRRKTEDRRRKTEDRRPKTEDRRRKTEDGRPKTEDRRRKTKVSSSSQNVFGKNPIYPQTVTISADWQPIQNLELKRLK
jgi:hypothetical protein